MNAPAHPLPPNGQAIVDRLIAAGHADDRVLAAFLGGSYARGTADAYSDLDLGLITTDAAYDGFLDGLRGFVGKLGAPVFFERFGLPFLVFFIVADGTECELVVGRAGSFQHIHSGPYRVLLDKTGLLTDAVFTWPAVAPAEQTETLRRLITWFWHDLSHFITGIARGQLWWAHGQLEIVRLVCVNLARLGRDFAAAADGYEKVELAVPVTQLAPLQETVGPLEEDAMLRAARVRARGGPAPSPSCRGPRAEGCGSGRPSGPGSRGSASGS
jgi:hypothetical protein